MALSTVSSLIYLVLGSVGDLIRNGSRSAANIKSNILSPPSAMITHIHQRVSMTILDHIISMHIFSELGKRTLLTKKAREAAFQLEICGILGISYQATVEYSNEILNNKHLLANAKVSKDIQWLNKVPQTDIIAKKFWCSTNNSYGIEFRRDSHNAVFYYNSASEMILLPKIDTFTEKFKDFLFSIVQHSRETLQEGSNDQILTGVIRAILSCIFYNMHTPKLMDIKYGSSVSDHDRLKYFYKTINDKFEEFATGKLYYGQEIKKNLFVQGVLCKVGHLYTKHVPVLVYDTKNRGVTVHLQPLNHGIFVYCIAVDTGFIHMPLKIQQIQKEAKVTTEELKAAAFLLIFDSQSLGFKQWSCKQKMPFLAAGSKQIEKEMLKELDKLSLFLLQMSQNDHSNANACFSNSKKVVQQSLFRC